MTHVPFELDTIFAGYKSLLADLKVQDTHFARLIETYHTVNRAIHRIETNVEAASDAHLEDLKKQRLAMLDEAAQILARARQESCTA